MRAFACGAPALLAAATYACCKAGGAASGAGADGNALACSAAALLAPFAKPLPASAALQSGWLALSGASLRLRHCGK